MIGTALNVAGILIGGLGGLVRRKPLSLVNESFFKVALGVFTVFYGLRLTWISVNGTFLQISKQLLIAVLALVLGKMAGQLLHLQKMSNSLGRQARERMSASKPADPRQLSEGFKTCTALFCAAPLAILGSVQDGLAVYYSPLALKPGIDGLAPSSFIPSSAWGTHVREQTRRPAPVE